VVAADVVGFAVCVDADVVDADVVDADVVGADVVDGDSVVGGAVVLAAEEAVVAESSPLPVQAATSSAAQQIRNRVVCAMTQIYQARGGVRSRGEGA
jgi:hypothetical protein